MKFGALAGLGNKDLYVVPRYQKFMERWRTKADPVREAEVLTHILTKNQERVRTGSWSVSSCGMCLRKQQFVYHGVTPSPLGSRALNIFANGDYVHLRHQVAGLIDGYLTDVETPVADESMKVRGTIDGILDNGDLLEIKSCNANTYRQVMTLNRPLPYHVRQATGYMQLTGATCTRFLYECKNTNELWEIPYELDRDDMLANEDDWDSLNRAERDGYYHEMLEDCILRRGTTFSQCQFHDTCHQQVHP